ncbi:MAG: LysR family transcriptional regulator [Amycolatopsis sp.]|uniref:LysR family transcriptional regulator n=1 Tax=Amycolatopsis sp. TaxID=37632 RepID=UPI002626E62E|nr:LysR family transcriptional regulator [Amycolatopsis sp.]MCU1679560.1 LysR family transcriptional regulator [Amycolatopsis sp.]
MNQLETRDLVYFLAVAEELHFGRAARQLGIAQPPLSRAIARLERRMGVTLFDRTTRQVALTPGGTVFMDRSRKVLTALDRAVTDAQEAGRQGRLVVAVRPGVGPGVLAELFSSYGQVAGASPTEVVFTYDEAKAVENGTADIALLCRSSVLQDLESLDLALERPVALLPATHPLATRNEVSTEELAELDAYTSRIPTEPHDSIVDRVAMGRLVVVVGESVRDRLGRSVVAVPVKDFPDTMLTLAWAPARRHPALDGFLSVARNGNWNTRGE